MLVFSERQGLGPRAGAGVAGAQLAEADLRESIRDYCLLFLFMRESIRQRQTCEKACEKSFAAGRGDLQTWQRQTCENIVVDCLC